MDLFLNEMTNLICSRCSNSNYVHHKGSINKFLIPSKNINLNFYNNYFNDLENGFFHCLSLCYIYYILNNNKFDTPLSFNHHGKNNIRVDKNILSLRIIASLLLHNFLKSNGFSQDEYDIELKNYFSNLIPETYKYSSCCDENNLLVKCNIIEIRRYNNYKDRVDDRYYKLYSKLTMKQKQEIEKFYNNTRPSLEYFYKNRDEIFIRHGLEYLGKCNVNSIFPPNNSFLVVDKLESYPIEIDRVPFGYNNTDSNKQSGFCSNHGCKKQFNRIKGFITYNDFISKGGKIINTQERDHLYAKSSIDINNWKFLYQNVKHDNKQKVELEKKNINIISKHLLSQFFIFIKLFQDRLIVLNNTS